MSENQTYYPTPRGIHPNVTHADSCGFMVKGEWQPCGKEAHWRQQGSGIPLCMAHSSEIVHHGGKVRPIKDEVSARPSEGKIG